MQSHNNVLTGIFNILFDKYDMTIYYQHFIKNLLKQYIRKRGKFFSNKIIDQVYF